MSEVTTSLIWNGDFKFTASNQTGQQTTIDCDSIVALGPLEMLLSALGACSASDVVNILTQMRQPVSRLEVSLNAFRRPDQPRYLTSAVLRFDLWGELLRPHSAQRAIALSLNKYCSVYHSIRNDLDIKAEFRINDSQPTSECAYQNVSLSEALQNAL